MQDDPHCAPTFASYSPHLAPGRRIWGWGWSCVSSCTETFLKPLFRDFCPAGWEQGGCLPCQGSCCGQDIAGWGDPLVAASVNPLGLGSLCKQERETQAPSAPQSTVGRAQGRRGFQDQHHALAAPPTALTTWARTPPRPALSPRRGRERERHQERCKGPRGGQREGSWRLRPPNSHFSLGLYPPLCWIFNEINAGDGKGVGSSSSPRTDETRQLPLRLPFARAHTQQARRPARTRVCRQQACARQEGRRLDQAGYPMAGTALGKCEGGRSTGQCWAEHHSSRCS